jgi:plasmid stabilization system protein ParE
MTEYAVLVMARAQADLLAVRRWLSQPGSGLKAQLKIARIVRALNELRFTPQRWPSGPAGDTRQRVIEGYTVVYRIDEALMRVRVVRIFGPYQDRSPP